MIILRRNKDEYIAVLWEAAMAASCFYPMGKTVLHKCVKYRLSYKIKALRAGCALAQEVSVALQLFTFCYVYNYEKREKL